MRTSCSLLVVMSIEKFSYDGVRTYMHDEPYISVFLVTLYV